VSSGCRPADRRRIVARHRRDQRAVDPPGRHQHQADPLAGRKLGNQGQQDLAVICARASSSTTATRSTRRSSSGTWIAGGTRPTHTAFGKTFEYYDSEFGEAGAITDVKVIDENTARGHAQGAFCGDAGKLSLAGVLLDGGSPRGHEAGRQIRHAGEQTASAPGPFKFVEWVKDDHITLENEHDWWGGAPRLSNLISRSIPNNSSARFAELKAARSSKPTWLRRSPAAVKDPNITVYNLPALSTAHTSPFQQCSQAVRQTGSAPGHCSRGQLGRADQAVLRQLRPIGLARSSRPAVLGSNPDVKPYEYNPAEGQGMLAKLGFRTASRRTSGTSR